MDKNMGHFRPILEGIQSLGLANITMAQVTAVMKQMHPKWAPGGDDAEVIRSIFLRIKKKNRQDNVG